MKREPKQPAKSRVQSTRLISRNHRQPSNPALEQLAGRLGVEVYDSVEQANQAGLPMPSQFG